MGNQDDFLRGGRADRRRRGGRFERIWTHTARIPLNCLPFPESSKTSARVLHSPKRGGRMDMAQLANQSREQLAIRPLFSTDIFLHNQLPPLPLSSTEAGRAIRWQKLAERECRGEQGRKRKQSFSLFPFLSLFPDTILGGEPRSRSMERRSTGGRWRRSKRGISFFFLFLRYRND